MTILAAFLVLPNLIDVAGQDTETVIARTIGRQATIVVAGAGAAAAAAAGVAIGAAAIDEDVAHITDKKVERL